MKQSILIINGPIGSGKSTVVELLMSRHEKLFRASFDKIKWLISDYSAGKYVGVVSSLLHTISAAALHEGFSLVVEGNVRILKDQNKNFLELAQKNASQFFEINIEAPLAVLEERFKQRIISATKTGSKISVTEMESMMERYNAYLRYKNHNVPTFDSSLLTAEQIIGEIEKIIFAN